MNFQKVSGPCTLPLVCKPWVGSVACSLHNAYMGTLFLLMSKLQSKQRLRYLVARCLPSTRRVVCHRRRWALSRSIYGRRTNVANFGNSLPSKQRIAYTLTIYSLHRPVEHNFLPWASKRYCSNLQSAPPQVPTSCRTGNLTTLNLLLLLLATTLTHTPSAGLQSGHLNVF